MNISHKTIDRIRITGPIDQFDKAIKHCHKRGYDTVIQGPLRKRNGKFNFKRFGITAEREVQNEHVLCSDCERPLPWKRIDHKTINVISCPRCRETKGENHAKETRKNAVRNMAGPVICAPGQQTPYAGTGRTS